MRRPIESLPHRLRTSTSPPACLSSREEIAHFAIEITHLLRDSPDGSGGVGWQVLEILDTFRVQHQLVSGALKEVSEVGWTSATSSGRRVAGKLEGAPAICRNVSAALNVCVGGALNTLLTGCQSQIAR
ncbi:hypothetical protein KC357_g261 [Hortaea werneckii]|nr:hypothetical protein KC357_g261 [Hortaea werneckii]